MVPVGVAQVRVSRVMAVVALTGWPEQLILVVAAGQALLRVIRVVAVPGSSFLRFLNMLRSFLAAVSRRHIRPQVV